MSEATREIDPEVEKAFKEARSFEPGFYDSIAHESKAREEAQTEAESASSDGGSIALDQHGLSPGMMLTVQPILQSLYNGWAPVKRTFSTAVQQYDADLKAYDNLQEKIAELEEKKAQADKTIREKYAGETKWKENNESYSQARTKFDELQQREDGRSPNEWHWSIYFLVLFLVGATEVLINYETLLSYFGLPALAVGSALGIALVFAIASHVHGSALKQHEHFFGPAVVARNKSAKITLIILSLLFLVAALGLIGYARYDMLSDAISAAGRTALSRGASGPPVTLTVGISLFANILVYGAGLFVAYYRHDVSPDFVAAASDKEKKRKAHDKTDKHRRNQVNQEIAAIDNEIKAQENVAKHDHKGARRYRQMLKQIDEHERSLVSENKQRIDAVLEAYKYALVQAIRGVGGAVTLVQGEKKSTIVDYAPRTLEYPRAKIDSAIGRAPEK